MAFVYRAVAIAAGVLAPNQIAFYLAYFGLIA